MLKRRKGSLTVEAVLILPIFMATILFISYFVKAHYVQDIVQDALTEAVMDVSAVSYPYYLSGALEFRNDIQEGTDSRREKLKQDFESVAELIEHVQNTGEAVKNKDIGGTIDNASGTIESAKTAIDAVEGISPIEIFSFGKHYAANKGINAAEDYIARKLILGSMGNTLSVDGKNIVDRMSALGIEGGLDGFDFTGSVFYGEDDVIDVQVKYKLSKVDPFGFIKGVTLKNRVVCRAWMGGVDIDGDGGIKRVTVPAKIVVGEEDPEKDVDRTFKTCYIIPSSKTSNRYHFHDCSSLREKGDSGKMKTVAAVQVPFVKTDGEWAPEGSSITYQGKAYTFCGNCAKGAFRADGEKSEEPPAKDGGKEAFEDKKSSKWIDDTGKIIWPPNNGAVAGSEEIVNLGKGTTFGRIGSDKGTFVAPPKTSSDELSLAPGTDLSNYTEYVVIKPIPGVEKATVAPWFDKPGGGTQFKLPMTIKELIIEGYIVPK